MCACRRCTHRFVRISNSFYSSCIRLNIQLYCYYDHYCITSRITSFLLLFWTCPWPAPRTEAYSSRSPDMATISFHSKNHLFATQISKFLSNKNQAWTGEHAYQYQVVGLLCISQTSGPTGSETDSIKVPHWLRRQHPARSQGLSGITGSSGWHSANLWDLRKSCESCESCDTMCDWNSCNSGRCMPLQIRHLYRSHTLVTFSTLGIWEFKRVLLPSGRSCGNNVHTLFFGFLSVHSNLRDKLSSTDCHLTKVVSPVGDSRRIIHKNKSIYSFEILHLLQDLHLPIM